MAGRAAQGKGTGRAVQHRLGAGQRAIGAGADGLPCARRDRRRAVNGVETQLPIDVAGRLALTQARRGPDVGQRIARLAKRRPLGPCAFEKGQIIGGMDPRQRRKREAFWCDNAPKAHLADPRHDLFGTRGALETGHEAPAI